MVLTQNRQNLIFVTTQKNVRIALAKLASLDFDMDLVGDYEFNSFVSMPHVPQ